MPSSMTSLNKHFSLLPGHSSGWFRSLKTTCEGLLSELMFHFRSGSRGARVLWKVLTAWLTSGLSRPGAFGGKRTLSILVSMGSDTKLGLVLLVGRVVSGSGPSTDLPVGSPDK